MSDAGIRQARQSDSRKGSPGNHDVTGDAGQLVISGFEIGAGDERRQFDHPFADAAQGGVRGHDERGTGPAADELFTDEERAGSVRGVSGGIGADHKGGETLRFFWAIALYHKVKGAYGS